MKGGRVVEKRQEPKIAAKDAVPAMVIRSCCRRPLLFRSPSGTLRLAPGESLEMPETWTGGVELRRLMQSGLVVCAKPERRAPAAHPPAAVEEEHPPLAVETHENWLEANRYLNMDDLKEHKKLALKQAA